MSTTCPESSGHGWTVWSLFSPCPYQCPALPRSYAVLRASACAPDRDQFTSYRSERRVIRRSTVTPGRSVAAVTRRVLPSRVLPVTSPTMCQSEPIRNRNAAGAVASTVRPARTVVTVNRSVATRSS